MSLNLPNIINGLWGVDFLFNYIHNLQTAAPPANIGS